MISEELRSFLSTYLWMKDQMPGAPSLSPIVSFDGVNAKLKKEMEDWFNTLDISNPRSYKADVGPRKGMFPTALNEHIIMFQCDIYTDSSQDIIIFPVNREFPGL